MSSRFHSAPFIIPKTTRRGTKGDGGRNTTWIPSPWLVAYGRRAAQSTARQMRPPRLNLMIKSLSPVSRSHIRTARARRLFSMTLNIFHPAVAAWFLQSFAAPTPAQAEAWPAIKAGRNVLIAAPTGSGKTLAAFLATIDALVREGLRQGLPDETSIVYISPIKALSNAVRKKL